MTATPEDALKLLRKIRMDLTNAQAKLTNAIEAIAALPATPRTICPECRKTNGGHYFSCKYNRDGPNYQPTTQAPLPPDQITAPPTTIGIVESS